MFYPTTNNCNPPLNNVNNGKGWVTSDIRHAVTKWRQEYVSIRWGNAVPSWEERKTETEEMLNQWLQKHFYWN